jgi:hypothetical protein
MDGTRVREVAAALIAADLIVEDRSTGQRRYTTKARLALAVTGAIRGEGGEGGR